MDFLVWFQNSMVSHLLYVYVSQTFLTILALKKSTVPLNILYVDMFTKIVSLEANWRSVDFDKNIEFN